MSYTLNQPRKSTRRSILAAIPSSVEFSPILKRRSVAPKSAHKPVNKNHLLVLQTPLNKTLEPRASTPIIPQTQTPKSRALDPIWAKLQRDLNSPSAGAHLRANRALKSPSYRNQVYGAFDVPHERQDLITEEERRPIVPKTVPEVFANCKVYVEVRTGDDNRSAGIKNRLLREGISVIDKLNKGTTHVIFKDGLLSTYKNAAKLGIPVTTILWIDACISQKRLVDTDKFKISNIDRYERPELYKRIRRPKSVQPEISKYSGPMKALVDRDRSMSQNDSLQSCTMTEIEEPEPEMELTLQFTPKPMQTTLPPLIVADKLDFNSRRITTFTPNPMEQTEIVSKIMIDRRRTLFTPHSSQGSQDRQSTNEGHGFSNNSSNTIVFNSKNRISKLSRRSVFDISMNILDLNCKALCEKKDTVDSTDPTPAAKTPNRTVEKIKVTQAAKPAIIRKRKLFSDNTQDDECKENLNKSVPVQVEKKNKLEIPKPSSKTPQPPKKTQSAVDRRKTLSYFRIEKPKDSTLTAKVKSPVKPVPATKYIVCTNMSSTDKAILGLAIQKLGGKVENEVTFRTTHVVSPNEDRTMNILRGVIGACFIVNANWIHESIAKNKWLETSIYQHSICDTNRVYERSILGTKNYKNLTFANHGLFLLNKETIDNPKKVDYLKEIITLCNGTITDNKSLAKFIVSDKPIDTTSDSQIVVVSTYIFDSAMKGSFLEVTRYHPKATQA